MPLVSDKATRRLQRSPARRSRSELGFRAWCALLERTSSKWTYRQAARQASSYVGGGKRCASIISSRIFVHGNRSRKPHGSLSVICSSKGGTRHANLSKSGRRFELYLRGGN